jgi:hypothetical protein
MPLARHLAVRHREDDLERASWLDYLETVATTDDGLRINGQRVTDSQRRALHRWRVEGASPSFFSADRFLTAFDLHIDDFFIHCLAHSLPIWASGHAPVWHDDDALFERRWSA